MSPEAENENQFSNESRNEVRKRQPKLYGIKNFESLGKAFRMSLWLIILVGLSVIKYLLD